MSCPGPLSDAGLAACAGAGAAVVVEAGNLVSQDDPPRASPDPGGGVLGGGEPRARVALSNLRPPRAPRSSSASSFFLPALERGGGGDVDTHASSPARTAGRGVCEAGGACGSGEASEDAPATPPVTPLGSARRGHGGPGRPPHRVSAAPTEFAALRSSVCDYLNVDPATTRMRIRSSGDYYYCNLKISPGPLFTLHGESAECSTIPGSEDLSRLSTCTDGSCDDANQAALDQLLESIRDVLGGYSVDQEGRKDSAA